jgi:hypothetical protein
VVVAVVAVAAKPSSWFERSYPSGILSAFDRVQARDPQLRVFANETYGDWMLLRRPELRGRLAFDIRFELMSKKELQRLLGIRWRSDGWQQRVAPYNLFVLKKGPESRLASGLLRQPGARVEYRGQGAIVIFRPSRQR